jgi:hypothetical protein
MWVTIGVQHKNIICGYGFNMVKHSVGNQAVSFGLRYPGIYGVTNRKAHWFHRDIRIPLHVGSVCIRLPLNDIIARPGPSMFPHAWVYTYHIMIDSCVRYI